MMQRSIEVAMSIEAGFAQVCGVLGDDRGVVSSDDATPDRYPPRRIVLGVDLGSGTSVHQEALVRLGVTQATETWLVVPVAWEATGRTRLFPTFAGELEASEADDGTRLRLHGTYTVPLGVVGWVGDSVVGWRLAHRSLDALLIRLGRQLEVEADRHRQSMPDLLTPEWEHSEIYIG
jgi:hypothetical protein